MQLEAHGDRPHLVMLVNNAIVGDSRVVKSAQSALDAGYRVTVVGMRNRYTSTFDADQGVLIYRAEVDAPHHQTFELRTIDQLKSQVSLPDTLRSEPKVFQWQLRDLQGRGRLTKRLKWVRPLSARAAMVSRKVAVRTTAARNTIRANAQRITSSFPGSWRKIWPFIVDHEQLFLKALIDLKPDLIHSHDYHPMAGAAAYATLMAQRGKYVPWVYDAHEWAPGQILSGPKEASIGWIAAEAELIQRADAVISVSEELADRMKRRHSLPARPTVVPNAPLATFTPSPS